MKGKKFHKNLLSIYKKINVLAVFYSWECGMIKSYLLVCCWVCCLFFFLNPSYNGAQGNFFFIRPLNIYANSYVSNACHRGGISQLFLADCSSFLRTAFHDSVVTVPAPYLK